MRDLHFNERSVYAVYSASADGEDTGPLSFRIFRPLL